MKITAALFALPFAFASVQAAAPASGAQLAAQLAAARPEGSSLIRLRMENAGSSSETLQLQIKERRSRNAVEVVYQVLFPKERKGEAVLLRKSASRAATGSIFVPPNNLKPITDFKAPLFGSALAYEDVLENFYAWSEQTLLGTETIENVSCQILESKPGKAERSNYGSVRSWIDLRRMVPLRIEKYSGSGQLARRIETTRVVTIGGHAIPANLTIQHGRGTTTELDGSKIKQDVSFSDREFTPEGLTELGPPRSAPE